MQTKTNIWHTLVHKEVLAVLQSDPVGLSKIEAAARLAQYGPNRLPDPKKRSGILRFLSHFHNVLIFVLIGAAAITAALQHWVDTGVILAVVLANAIIGYIQEGKAEKAMETIWNMLAPHAAVLRDGQRISIEGENIVPGDIVLLEAGDKVPADLRLIKVHGLQIQEAILTGESVPIEKHIKPVATGAALGDRSCMAFSGTMVTRGQAQGVVIGTGGMTELGRISSLLADVKMLTTPLVTQMNTFARWLTVFILLLAAALLIFGYFAEHYDFSELFMAVVGMSVAAIPEGMPAVLTITLAIGVQAMARRNAIVRRLPAIETLGSVSVICTDKTGTLTRNEMMVSSVATSTHVFILEGTGYEPKGAIWLHETVINGADNDVLTELARAAALCNDASLREHEGTWHVEGDPMEGALLAFSNKAGLDFQHEKAAWMRRDIIPFDAQHRFMATLNHDPENHAVVFLKGAPEQVLKMCIAQRTVGGGTETLDAKYWHEQAESIAARGQRVLAFAVKPIPLEHTTLEMKDIQNGLILLGLTGLNDPPRPEVVEAIAQCLRAGIRVKMITGDHAATAKAIGRQIGLQNPDKVLTGADLDHMDDAELALTVLDTDIFARTSPEHKLRLVMALQAHGITAAMTGDGVNDAPALKRADVGIAMGKTSNEAAKEAAELVLADDNFASIVAAVREGRTVYDNIKKVISWTLPTNAGEATCIIVALLFGMTLPVTPIQILWINLITAVTLGIALAFEPTEENTMRRPPRKRTEALIDGGLLWHIVLVSILFLCGVFGIFSYAVEKGYSTELAQTMALNTLVVMEIFHLFFIRNIYGASLTWKAVRGTKTVWTVVIIITLAQFLITYVPLLQRIFETESVPFFDGVIIVGIGAALFAIVEIEKQIRVYLGSSKSILLAGDSN